ncbi:Acyl-CoA-binding protein [Rhynchospora pubera]|uniref:Acyl-CoA-binding protein n=1 Tax=Rhynchospora pubera TaxID=906938 RepID=A0AAV8EIH6_9POAL|nr:Acyl-CoA-binding protein [Rhynchospora pubera]
MGIQEEFSEYSESVKKLPAAPSDEDKLELYALYKQATVGPVTIPRPNRFNMMGRYKWDAWKAVEGKSKEEAMKDYIAKVKELQAAAAATTTTAAAS